MATHESLRRRLLQDIEELQTKPYPNIHLHVNDNDLTTACLVLRVEAYNMDMHLTVNFPPRYPLVAPRVHMDSDVSHPNIFDSYICASILNTEEGYTSAYTLKSIAIQLLSFFSSDTITQEGGVHTVDLKKYRELGHADDDFKCPECRFGHQDFIFGTASIDGENESTFDTWGTTMISNLSISSCPIDKLPSEILVLIFDTLETEQLITFAEAWDKVSRAITEFDILRTRELQCFCLKKDYTKIALGVGVFVDTNSKAKYRRISSEFDLLSHEGFYTHRIRWSIQGVRFNLWLPLPISQGHWRKVKSEANNELQKIANAANMQGKPAVFALYHFMNEIVVKLNQDLEGLSGSNPGSSYGYEPVKSTMKHASEKAIESYFHLFHLLLCLATEDRSIVMSANNAIRRFVEGNTGKDKCENIGHLLIHALISQEDVESKMKLIIKEAMCRNVVWMLDKHPELSYREPAGVSEYRLTHSFAANKTSYRLFMFLNLFRRVAVHGDKKATNAMDVGMEELKKVEHGEAKSPEELHLERLVKLRDDAFKRHGAPPRGKAKELADSIKTIHQVNTFHDFLQNMGQSPLPTKEELCDTLKRSIQNSMDAGYTREGLRQEEALYLRYQKEPSVDGAGLRVMSVNMDRFRSGGGKGPFWPSRGGGAGGGRGGGRGRGGYGGRGGRG